MTDPHPPLDHIPREILCAADYEALAPQFIAAPTLAYIAGGSGEELSLLRNRQAFSRRAILPRLLRAVGGGHTRCTLFGQRWRHPVMLAPVAYQQQVHPAGERDTARGAAATDACLVVSTLASLPLEAVVEAAGPARWFQLYLQAQREATLDLVRRAEAAGYGALVVTLDTAIQSPSRRALRAGFVPPGATPANLAGYAPVVLPALGPDDSRIFQGAMAQAPTLADLQAVIRATALPVVVKGVQRADDARMLREAGAAGLVVSNHGGRALDGAPASLDMLAEIRQAVGPDYPLLFDGGVRSGSDIFKAIALGASAVMIGRLQVYALAVAGALGVAHLVRSLHEELELCMAMAGCATLADIDSSLIREIPAC